MASADRLIEVFTEAKAQPVGAERDQFLSEACHDDPALKEQVRSLLQAHDGAGDFLKHTQLIPPVTPLTEKPGDRIGRYKLLQKIGEGGCGVVYMAEQEEPVRRRVAFKVIKLGMDTRQVVARFEAEGQALAMMDHPSIAKVFDAGATNTGRPYFVMELVRGIKITDYCDQNNLPTDERLKLFTQVCHAIQHAHQKGIIHRDIKPSNILVTVNDGVPVPKVIDFGIAKAIEHRLTDKTVFTAFEQFIGTPAYMSPEQAEMTSLDIDTRADIYSLGVLLYELLSGNTPFDAEKLVASGVAEIRRIIREQEPPKPSTRLNTLNDADLSTVAQRRQTDPPKLMQRIRGDLDWIVMKCLEKDRTRRYETANGLATDIQRHLQNEPVVARQPSNVYRFQKLIRRNKLAFAAVSAVIAALVIGMAASTALFFKAQAEKKKAQTQASKSEQVAQFLKDMLKGVGPSKALGRDTAMLREILDRTAERVGPVLTNQPEVEAELRNTIGSVYLELGDPAKAEGMFRRALKLGQDALGEDHPATADSLDGLGRSLWRLGKTAEAEPLVRKSLAIRRQDLGNSNADTAISVNNLGTLLYVQGKRNEAEPLFHEALVMRRKLLGDSNLQTAQSLHNLGTLLRDEGKFMEAEPLLREALAVQKAQLGGAHPDSVMTEYNLGLLLMKDGRKAEADPLLREAAMMGKKTLGEAHPDLAAGLARAGAVLLEQAKPAEAEPLLRQALAMQRKVWPAGHPEISKTLRLLGTTSKEQGRTADAEIFFREASQNEAEAKSAAAPKESK